MPPTSSRFRLLSGLVLLAVLPGLAPPNHAAVAADAYRVIGIKPTQVLTGTSFNAKVIPGGRTQFITVTSYLTGKRDERHAVNVRLDVFQVNGSQLTPAYSRDFGGEVDGFVGDGELEVMDLDGDGVREIIVSYKLYHSPVIVERRAEVLVYGEAGFAAAWTGPTLYDATKAVREVPEERRDSFAREIDLAATLRSRGRELHWDKRVVAVAGERLASPRSVDEVFPLRR